MKAIKIKDRIIKFNELPNKIKGIKIEELSNIEIYDLGVRDYVAQKIDIGFKKGKDYFDEENDYFTHKVLEKTIFETDIEEKDKEDKKDKTKDNSGNKYYKKIKKELNKKLRKGKLTKNQFYKIYTPIRKALIWCNTGDFDIALEEMQKLSYSNKKLQDIIDDIVKDINDKIENLSKKKNKK